VAHVVCDIVLLWRRQADPLPQKGGAALALAPSMAHHEE